MLGRLSEGKKAVLAAAEDLKTRVVTGGEEIHNDGTFCVVGIFKNEAEIVNEWLEHYTNEGCAHFFLIDNDSNDNYTIDAKYQTAVTVVIDPEKHAQAKLYNQHFGEKITKYHWTLVSDLDEFVYARKSFPTIRAFLHSIQDGNVTQIAIPWKIFGANGLNKIDQKEPPSCITGFTKRMDYDKEDGFQGVKCVKGDMKFNLCKCIIRSNAVKALIIHNHDLKYGHTVQSHYVSGESCDATLPFVPMNESRLKASPLHCNHYAIRSFDWFTRVKMTRGSAASAASTKAKSKIEFFHAFDQVSNDIDDYELRDKTHAYGDAAAAATTTTTTTSDE